ncbi:hypothetical protein Dimus_024652 [Dionaea muscipula]
MTRTVKVNQEEKVNLIETESSSTAQSPHASVPGSVNELTPQASVDKPHESNFLVEDFVDDSDDKVNMCVEHPKNDATEDASRDAVEL